MDGILHCKAKAAYRLLVIFELEIRNILTFRWFYNNSFLVGIPNM